MHLLTHQNEETLKTLQERQEFFVIRYQEQLRFTAEAQRAEQNGNMGMRRELLREKERFDRDLKNQAANILGMRQGLISKLSDTFVKLHEVQQHILDVKLGGVSQNSIPIYAYSS